MPALPNQSYIGARSALSGSVTSLTGSVTPQLVLPPDPYRSGFYLWNDTNQPVWVALNFTCNVTNQFSFKIAAQAGVPAEVPNAYWGPISAIWQTLPTTGNLLITSLS